MKRKGINLGYPFKSTGTTVDLLDITAPPWLRSISSSALLVNITKKIKGLPRGFPCSSVGKESACNGGDSGLIPRSGRSPGEGNGSPLQYSCLEIPMDRGACLQSMGSQRVGHNLASEHIFVPTQDLHHYMVYKVIRIFCHLFLTVTL